jgi:UV excision repair protein RAD23
MKVTLKTVTGVAFSLECEPSETIAALKAKIEAGNAALPATLVTAIYQGKVLQDSATLAEAGIAETGFVVVMAKKGVRPPLPTSCRSVRALAPAAAATAPRQAAEKKPCSFAPPAAAAHTSTRQPARPAASAASPAARRPRSCGLLLCSLSFLS